MGIPIIVSSSMAATLTLCISKIKLMLNREIFLSLIFVTTFYLTQNLAQNSRTPKRAKDALTLWSFFARITFYLAVRTLSPVILGRVVRWQRIDRLSVCLGRQGIPIATSEYISTWFRAYCSRREFGVRSARVSVPTLHYLLAHCCPYTCAQASLPSGLLILSLPLVAPLIPLSPCLSLFHLASPSCRYTSRIRAVKGNALPGA